MKVFFVCFPWHFSPTTAIRSHFSPLKPCHLQEIIAVLKEDGFRAVGAGIKPLEVIHFVHLLNNQTWWDPMSLHWSIVFLFNYTNFIVWGKTQKMKTQDSVLYIYYFKLHIK